MIWAILGIVLGLVVGNYLPFTYPDNYSMYVSIGILAAMDSIFGAVKASMEDKYDNLVFVTGLLFNGILAAFLSYVGDKMGVPLYYAPIFVFGGRLFSNFAGIRRLILEKWRDEKKLLQELEDLGKDE